MRYIKHGRYLLLMVLVGCNSTQELQTTETHATNTSSLGDELGLYQQAISDLSQNKLARAKSGFEKMTKQQPELAGPWANLALVNLNLGDTAKAKSLVETALSKNPKLAQALNLAGYIENELANALQAKDYYLRAIASKPGYANAHFNLALLYDTYLQDIPNALVHYRKYLSVTQEKDPKTQRWVDELTRILAEHNR